MLLWYPILVLEWLSQRHISPVAGGREAALNKMKKKLTKTFKQTRFPEVTMIPVSANPGGTEGGSGQEPLGVAALVEAVNSEIKWDEIKQ